MAVMIGLGIAGLASGIAGSLSASSDAAAAAEAQYNYSQYQARRATDAANLKRAYNFRQQLEQRQSLFNAAYQQYYFNTGQAKDRYTSQVRQTSEAYLKTRGVLMSQFERNGLSKSAGSGRALAYSAMRQASRQLQGASSNLADTRMQLRDKLDTTLSAKINAEAPSLFIPGTGPNTASGMSQTLGALSAGIGGFSQGFGLGQAIDSYMGPPADTGMSHMTQGFVGPPNPYTNANSGAFIFAQ